MRRLLSASILFASVVACSDGGTGSGDGRLRIVTTVSPITNIVATVAGTNADVEGVVPEGENSHEFEPRPSVARALSDADLVFVNGLELETPTIELARSNLKEGAEIVELGAMTLEPDDYIFDFSFPRSEGNPNPHLWTNPAYALRFAEIVKETLSERDPGNASDYERNFDLLGGRILAFDEALREATETVPEENRKLLTYHDSFPYFARDYGWEVIGAIQPSDFSEPSPREVARLIVQIREEDVPAIFGSEVFPSPVLERIADESGAVYVDDLRDDDLPGEPGEAGHTLLGLLRFDYVTIVEALGGNPAALEEVDIDPGIPDEATYA